MCECCCNAPLSKMRVKKLFTCNVLFCLLSTFQEKDNAQLKCNSSHQSLFFLVDVRNCPLRGMRMYFPFLLTEILLER